MATLSAKELTALEDQLGLEQLLVKKFRTYANTATDSAIQTKCQQIADRHQQHFQTLLAHLN